MTEYWDLFEPHHPADCPNKKAMSGYTLTKDGECLLCGCKDLVGADGLDAKYCPKCMEYKNGIFYKKTSHDCPKCDDNVKRKRIVNYLGDVCEELKKMIKEIEADDRLPNGEEGHYKTATIDVNAPLALIQLEMEMKLKCYKWAYREIRRATMKQWYKENMPSEAENITCDDCKDPWNCEYAYDAYNTDGDCLAVK